MSRLSSSRQVGWSVTLSEFVKSGTGQYTTTYDLEPGKGRDIEDICMLKEDSKNRTVEGKINEIVELLKNFSFVDSVLLFGSRARGVSGRDIDICIVPSREIGLKERLTLESIMPSGVDISIYFELPIHIRKRIFEEGEVLYSKNMYRLLTLGKETDLEYSGYRRYREYYNRAARERMRKMWTG